MNYLWTFDSQILIYNKMKKNYCVRINIVLQGKLPLKERDEMNGNVELLDYIYQNSQMGVKTLNRLRKITQDEEFKHYLNNQYLEYLDIHQKAKYILNKNGYKEIGITTCEKMRTCIMIKLNTLMDKSTSHIAEMLIIGSNMGIIDGVKNIKKYKNAKMGILQLMNKLVQTEENNVQQLKRFL